MRVVTMLGLVFATAAGCSSAGTGDAAPSPGPANDAGGDDSRSSASSGSSGNPIAPGDTDAGADGSSSASLCSTGLAFCESFESGTLDPTVWTVQGLPPTIDATFAARGTHSLHVRIDPTSTVHISRISETKTFPAKNNSLFGRAFVYAKTAVPTFHMGIIWGAHEKGAEAVYAIGTGNQNILVNFKDATTDNGVNDHEKFPVDRWVCLEWQFDGMANQVLVWVDGAPDPGATLTGYTAPLFDHLFVGMGLYSGMTPVTTSYEMWLDEIAVDDHRITCAR
jgi:hypothetical protein